MNFFYDLPVYRLPEEIYYRKRCEYIDNVLYPPNAPYSEERRAKEKLDPSAVLGLRDHLQRSYGGMWRFNEIIGYIRLHFLGSQLREEYYAVRRERIVRTRKKQLEFHSWKLVAEHEVPIDSSNDEIYSIILQYIDDCRKTLRLRHIDSSGFERIGPYVDWRALHKSDM